MDQTLGSSSEDILAVPVSGGRRLATDERHNMDLSTQINGWGADLDPRMRPGVPREKKYMLGSEHLYPNIPQQVPKVKIHKSTEHARLTPVFGTSCPPQYLSGLMRDYAYKFSEGRFRHWLVLMAADRVNVVEDLIIDLAHGHIPNVFKEMGLKSELKYNKKGLAKKAAFVGLGIVAYMAFTRSRDRRRAYATF